MSEKIMPKPITMITLSNSQGLIKGSKATVASGEMSSKALEPCLKPLNNSYTPSKTRMAPKNNPGYKMLRAILSDFLVGSVSSFNSKLWLKWSGALNYIFLSFLHIIIATTSCYIIFFK